VYLVNEVVLEQRLDDPGAAADHDVAVPIQRAAVGTLGARGQAGRSILAGTVAGVERATTPVGGRGRRYGLVMLEDDNVFAEALTELLEADGRIEVAGRAREGREGVDLVDALEPDVVLTDIALPVMDGVEATREILRRHPGMPVVAMTGWEYEERALEVREAGAVDYVSKSRLGPDLVEVLVAAARARRGAPSGPSTG
jgi:CheY-like chemotaxis protein